MKAVVKKSLHVVNRLNPATLLLRNGILAAMKVNLMKVPQRLKYAYLSDQQAQQRGIDMAKFARLKQVKTKLENIFFGAGGKPENLRQAILTGRGNKNKDVNLGYADPDLLSGITPQTPVSRILGRQMFYSENVEGMEGLGSLGDPATGASIAAATGAIGAIAALLKSIGNIFPKKGTGSSDYDESDTATTVTSSTDSSTTAPTVSESISSSTSSSPSTESYNSDSSSGTSTENSSTPAQRMDNNDSSQGADTQQQSNAQARAESTSQSSDSTSTSEDNTNESQGNNATGTTNANAKGQPKPGFWAANKKWLLPTSIGVSVLLLSVGGYAIVKSSKNKPAPKPSSPAVNGLPAMKKHKKKKRKRPSISSKKKSPTLFMM